MSLPQTGPSLKDLLRLLRRRRLIFLVTAGICFALAVILAVFTQRRFTSTSTIELQKSASDSLGLESMMQSAGGGASDALSLNIDLQTEISILESDGLALKVIQELNLAKNPDFQPHFNPIGYLLGLISPAGVSDPQGASLQDSPRLSERLIEVFEKNLKVKTVAGTRLIEVSYSNPNARLSAEVINKLVQALIDYSFQVRFTATQQTSTWLEGQLGDLRERDETLQAKVVAMQRETGLFGVGGTDPQGKPVIYSPVLDRLQQSTAALSQAQANVILKGAVYHVAASGSPDLISQLVGPMGGLSTGVPNSMALIQTLRAQQATQQATIQEDSTKFGKSFPRIVEEKAALLQINKDLQAEIGRVRDRAKNDYDIALQQERGAQARYSADRKAADDLNDKTINYAIVRREADESEQLYQSLLSRLREAGVLEGLHSSNLTVLDRARPAAKPSKPNIPLYLAGGLFLGPLLGFLGALLIDAVDTRFKEIGEIEAMGLTIFGVLPAVETGNASTGKLMVDTGSQFAEAVRTLRSAVLLARSVVPKVILIASGSPAEGKSSVSTNLAVALTQMGRKVLIVETDMRRSVLQKRFSLQSTTGLSNLLTTGETETQFEMIPDHPNLYALPAGPHPPFPSELLGSQRFQDLLAEWRTRFDHIVLDSPPVLPVTDVQLIVGQADVVLLVVRANRTARTSLERSLKLLMPHAKTSTIGIVFNAVPVSSSVYYEYYGYQADGYYGDKKSQ